MNLFFDTETSGQAEFRLPPDNIMQPRLVQLAVVLTDDQGQEIHSAKMLVKPEGWTISDGALAVHGITTEYADKHGIPVAPVLSVFSALARLCVRTVAFNHDFDELVMRGELMRLKRPLPFDYRESFCLMRQMTPVCKIPQPANRPWAKDPYKWPKLQEAYQHCFGQEFDKAHDAMADVRAMIAVYFWWTKHVLPTAPPQHVPHNNPNPPNV